jgi:deazaflavin-dependent oxidoreductase (nitroreductase family)
MESPTPEIREKLDRIAAHERLLSKTWLNSFLQVIGSTRWFAWLYSRFGPALDRRLLRSKGKVISRMYGLPTLLLVTTGARSGQKRESPLLYVRDGDSFVIVGTNFGGKPHPAWTANLHKTPAAQIVVYDETLDVTAELADEATWQRLWPRFSAVYRGYDAYLKRLTDRTPRMFVLRP